MFEQESSPTSPPNDKEKFIEEYLRLRRFIKREMSPVQQSSVFHRIAELQTIIGKNDLASIEAELKNKDG